MVQDSLLVPFAAGNGGIREMRESVDDSKVQFGLASFELGSGQMRRQKLVFLHLNGLNCPAVARGRANEFLADAKKTLDSGADGFHASVEIKEKAEVTTESIITRVCKFFIQDGEAEYSIQWLMDRYEQFILESSYKREQSINASGKSDRVVLFPAHESSQRFSSGRDALRAVAEPCGEWNWVFVKADPANLELIAGGSGSVDEMRECMAQSKKEVMFGLLRMGFGVGRLRRTKHVFITAIGAETPAVKRGRLVNVKPKMETALKPYAQISVSLEIMDEAEFTVQAVIDRVRQAAHIDDGNIDGDKAGGHIFSVEHFRAALQEEMGNEESRSQKEPWKSKGGFGDKTAEEIARLVRSPEGEFNWAIFSLNSSAKNSRPAAQNCMQLRPTGPSAPLMPKGGYAAASARSRSRTPMPPTSLPGDVASTEPQMTDASDAAMGQPSSRIPSLASLSSASEKKAMVFSLQSQNQPGNGTQVSCSSGGSMPDAQSMGPSSCQEEVGASRADPHTAQLAETAFPLIANAAAAPCWGIQVTSNSVRMAPKPAAALKARVRLSGALLKLSSGLLRRWQLRHFEISAGKLRWWTTLRQKHDGLRPSQELDLQGLSIQAKSATRFEMHTTSSKAVGRIYAFDVAPDEHLRDDSRHNLKKWVQALQQEAMTSAVLVQ